jgi:hypothetical protein
MLSVKYKQSLAKPEKLVNVAFPRSLAHRISMQFSTLHLLGDFQANVATFCVGKRLMWQSAQLIH